MDFSSLSVNEILYKGENKINDYLSSLANESLDRRLMEFDKDYIVQDSNGTKNGTWHETTQKILEVMGETIFNAFLSISKKNDFTFYFWPGYVTLLKKERILIKGDKIRPHQNSKEFYNGIGFSKKNTEKEYKVFRDCPATFYYYAALTPIKKDSNNNPLPKDEVYIGPTTHNWKIQQKKSSKFILKGGAEVTILHVGHKVQTMCKNNVLSIGIDRKDIEKSIRDIEKVLNCRNFNSSINQWSNVSIDSRNANEYISWPFNNDKTYDLNFKRRFLQYNAYKLWLSSVFNGNLCEAYKENTWVRSIIDKSIRNRSPRLSTRLKNFIDREAYFIKEKNEYYQSNIHFKHWYTLFFDNYDQVNELGTAMFLSNQVLDKRCLILVQNWVKYIYSQIRNLDYSINEDRIRLNITAKTQHNTNNFLNFSMNELQRIFKAHPELTSLGVIKSRLKSYRDILEISGYSLVNFERYKPNREKINLKECIITLTEMISNEIFCESSASLRTDMAQTKILRQRLNEKKLFNISGEDIIIFTDRSLLEIILDNILTNAVRNSANAEQPTVGIDFFTDIDFIILICFNNGNAMSEVHQNFINQSRWKHDSSGNKGIGLSTIKEYSYKLGIACTVEVDNSSKKTIVKLKIPLNK